LTPRTIGNNDQSGFCTTLDRGKAVTIVLPDV
jgi:hypothetical protein